MADARLILALHDHQPVGNFDGVFESSYQESYRPWLDAMEAFPEVHYALHTSGPLLEWLVEHHPDYIARVRALARSGRIEILGGGFYEPVLTMIPRRDRVGQIRTFTRYLEDLFESPIRGMWMPERVWEQHLVSSLVEAGIEYTILDDFHFERAGLGPNDLLGYYLTEDDGCLLKVFPICERLRYLIPFQEPHDTYEFLRGLAQKRPGATAVFADDGEKFGSWPGTRERVHNQGWLRRFGDMLTGNRTWLETTTFARVLDATLPLGKVYLPDSSYREMTEWVLPSQPFQSFMELARDAKARPDADRMRPFLRAGGFWSNFRSKYAECDEMYARMHSLSKRLAATPTPSPAAQTALYRSQCNCPYWHGAFGGLYLPHLRNAIYQNLIDCHNELDAAEGKSGPRVELEVADFNLDARQEVRLENDRLIALVRPAHGGHLYSLDVRHARTNILATLDRRPEPYHASILAAARGESVDDGRASVTEGVVLKQSGLDQALVYDPYPRKALVDHFYPLDATLDDVAACRPDTERGDFVAGSYLATVRRTRAFAEVALERPGWADGHLITLKKTLRLEPGRPTIEIDYELSNIPQGARLRFAVELNHAGMAGHADDRYFYDETDRDILGPLDSRLSLPATTRGLGLRDEWLDLDIRLAWSRPAGVWCFPIQTVSQSESGYELVYQSSAVIPWWNVSPDPSGRWSLRLSWSLDQASRVAAHLHDPALAQRALSA
jgi:alpha-amylase